MNINYNNIKIQNFLSIGKELEFKYKNGITLIVGTNGNGKSSMQAALFYVLFGKPFSKVKASSLQNKINKKDLLVTLSFDIDGEEFNVVRGMNPSVFKIYKGDIDKENLITQNATVREYQQLFEETILMTNETIFRQLIILGTNSNSSKPFLELTAKEKEEMFSTITDTEIFNHLKGIIKVNTQAIKTQLTELNYKQELLLSTIASEKIAYDNIRKTNEEFSNDNESRIKQLQDEIVTLTANKEKYTEGLKKLKAVKEKYDLNLVEQSTRTKEHQTLMLVLNDTKHTLQHIKRAKEGAVICEECNHTNYLIEAEIDAEDELNKTHTDVTTQIQILAQDIFENQIKIDKQKEGLLNGKRIKDNVTDMGHQIDQKQNQINSYQDFKPQDMDYSSITDKEKDLQIVNDELTKHNEKMTQYLYIANIVSSDNLKGLIINKQLPILNKFINMYLEKFSLLGYNFIVDKDFKEHIVSRNEESEFNQLSNGQKARISFSIMFAFLRLIEERNGTKMNVLVLDEVLDSSLDTNGREELLDILKEEFSKDKDIIIISHNEDVKEKIEIFNRIVTVKKDTFTYIEEEIL